MLKMFLISAGSVLATLGIVFMFSGGDAMLDEIDYASTQAATNNQPQAPELDLLRTRQTDVSELLATEENRPAARPAAIRAAQSEQPEATSNDKLTAAIAHQTSNADPDDIASEELQKLIARVLLEGGETGYAADVESEASKPQATSAKASEMFANTIISTNLAAPLMNSETTNTHDQTYINMLNDTNAPPKRVTQATTYKVKRGDNLAKISYIHYGRTSDYVTIFQANRARLKDPNHIFVGQTLTIPAL